MFYFYMFQCKDGTLYAGSTKHLKKREETHNSGRGSKYVRSRGGGRIIYSEGFGTLSGALKREAEVKGWSRELKMGLIKSKKRLLRSVGNNSFAVIFDMDGVIVNNAAYHFKSWAAIAARFNVKLTLEYFNRQMNGRRAEENVRHAIRQALSPERIRNLADQKERIYRQLYRPHIKAVKGLVDFLLLLKKDEIKTGMATSAPPANIRFVLGSTKTRNFFEQIVDSSQVKKGKPNPQVYLMAAKLLGVSPKNCVVFEDAFNGITAARRAGMKVVAIATSNKAKDLKHADLVIKDFSGLTVEKLQKLF